MAGYYRGYRICPENATAPNGLVAGLVVPLALIAESQLLQIDLALIIGRLAPQVHKATLPFVFKFGLAHILTTRLLLLRSLESHGLFPDYILFVDNFVDLDALALGLMR